MTLIAAYKSHNIPVLVGDILITRDDSDVETHCKKIHRISSNFVVGWCGNKSTAIGLFKDLYATFENQKVTKDAIETFLVNFDVSKLFNDKLAVSGWIVDDRNHCFDWWAWSSKEVDFDEFGSGFFNGTGAKFYKNLLNDKPTVQFHAESNNYDIGLNEVLTQVCSLTNGEYLSTDKSWRNRFGFAYEVLYLRDGEFKYVDDIFFTTIDVLVDKEGNPINYGIAQLIYRYKNYDDVSLIQIYDRINNEYKLNVFGRVFDTLDYVNKRTVSISVKALPIKSVYYCITFRIIDPSFIDGGFIVFKHESPPIRIQQNGKMIEFSFSPKFNSIIKQTVVNAKGKK